MAGSSDGAASQTGAIIEVFKFKLNSGWFKSCDCFLLIVYIDVSLY